MNKYIKFGIAFIAMLGTNAFAEGNCPQGQYPIGGGNGGWQGCAPIPGGGSGGGQSFSKPGRWLDSYGSLYWGKDKDGYQTYSYSVKKDNMSIADNSAYNGCVNAGYSECKKALGFWNSYLALAYDETGAIWGSTHEKESKAKKAVLDFCKKDNGKNCKILKTVNSRPDWVQ